jgi:tetratricopeptide (TPR) repeat protein
MTGVDFASPCFSQLVEPRLQAGRSRGVGKPPSGLTAVLFTVVLSACAVTAQPVTRVVHGREVHGRFVDMEAYSAYARAADLEQRGDLVGARAAYELALKEDPAGVHIYTRLGVLLCEGDAERAWQAFDAGAEVDSSYEPLWRERARCHLLHGQLSAASAAIDKALQLDPLRLETGLVLAAIRERQGRHQAARRLLDALVAQRPHAREAWEALREHARRHHDEPTSAYADARLAELKRMTGSELPVAPVRHPGTDEVDAALGLRDLEHARSLAVAAGVSGGQLALRAAALGHPDLAGEQAQLVLSADPDDGDAWVAALAAADLRQDAAAFERAVRALGHDPIAPSPLGARLFAEVLQRRLGEAAAAAWLEAYGPLPSPTDPLERAVTGR